MKRYTKTNPPKMPNIIKSVRVYEKNRKINIDYRLYPEYRSDKDRYRFSTGEEATKRGFQRVERDKVSLALAHYYANHEPKGVDIYFKDIAYKAIEEDRGNRVEDIHKDYLKILETYILPIFANKLVEEIKVSELKAWKNDLLTTKQLSKSRYIKYHQTLNFVFKYAYQNEIIMRNPMDLVDKRSKLLKPNNGNSECKYYTSQEVTKMLEASTGWFNVFLTVAFYSGLRTGELIALQWKDIDFSKNQIIVQRSKRHGKLRETTKTGICRVVDMPTPVAKALQTLHETRVSNTWIFPNPETKEAYYEASTITKNKLKPLLLKLGIPYRTLYATRHSFASLAVEKNIPLTYVQKQLGHAKLSTTMDYYVKNGFINQNQRDVRVDTLFD